MSPLLKRRHLRLEPQLLEITASSGLYGNSKIHILPENMYVVKTSGNDLQGGWCAATTGAEWWAVSFGFTHTVYGLAVMVGFTQIESCYPSCKKNNL